MQRGQIQVRSLLGFSTRAETGGKGVRVGGLVLCGFLEAGGFQEGLSSCHVIW